MHTRSHLRFCALRLDRNNSVKSRLPCRIMYDPPQNCTFVRITGLRSVGGEAWACEYECKCSDPDHRPSARELGNMPSGICVSVVYCPVTCFSIIYYVKWNESAFVNSQDTQSKFFSFFLAHRIIFVFTQDLSYKDVVSMFHLSGSNFGLHMTVIPKCLFLFSPALRWHVLLFRVNGITKVSIVLGPTEVTHTNSLCTL